MREPKKHLRDLLIAGVVAGLLTAFFHVHEELPQILRAPTSVLLTPVAICSGLCHYLSIALDVYGSVLLQLLANFAFVLPIVLIVRWFRTRRKSA